MNTNTNINIQAVVDTILENDVTMAKGIALMSAIGVSELYSTLKECKTDTSSWIDTGFYKKNQDTILTESLDSMEATRRQAVERAARHLCALNSMARGEGNAFLHQYIDISNTDECQALVNCFTSAWEEQYSSTPFSQFKRWLKAVLKGE